MLKTTSEQRPPVINDCPEFRPNKSITINITSNNGHLFYVTIELRNANSLTKSEKTKRYFDETKEL